MFFEVYRKNDREANPHIRTWRVHILESLLDLRSLTQFPRGVDINFFNPYRGKSIASLSYNSYEIILSFDSDRCTRRKGRVCLMHQRRQI